MADFSYEFPNGEAYRKAALVKVMKDPTLSRFVQLFESGYLEFTTRHTFSRRGVWNEVLCTVRIIVPIDNYDDPEGNDKYRLLSILNTLMPRDAGFYVDEVIVVPDLRNLTSQEGAMADLAKTQLQTNEGSIDQKINHAKALFYSDKGDLLENKRSACHALAMVLENFRGELDRVFPN